MYYGNCRLISDTDRLRRSAIYTLALVTTTGHLPKSV